MRAPLLAALITLSAAGAAHRAFAAEDVEKDIAITLKDNADDRWLYHDVERGFKLAKKQKKPLLVCVRCVP